MGVNNKMTNKDIYEELDKLDKDISEELKGRDGEDTHHIFERIHYLKSYFWYRIKK